MPHQSTLVILPAWHAVQSNHAACSGHCATACLINLQSAAACPHHVILTCTSRHMCLGGPCALRSSLLSLSSLPICVYSHHHLPCCVVIIAAWALASLVLPTTCVVWSMTVTGIQLLSQYKFGPLTSSHSGLAACLEPCRACYALVQPNKGHVGS